MTFAQWPKRKPWRFRMPLIFAQIVPAQQKPTPLHSVATDWIAGIVGILTIGGATYRGGKALIDRRKIESDRRKDEDRRRKERDEFIDKLPATLDSMAMAIAQNNKVAESLNNIGSIVSRLEDNQIEAKELRRIQAEQTKTAYYRCRPDGRAYEVSQHLCELFGLTAEEMLANDGAGWVAAIENPTETWGHWVASVTNNLPYEDHYVVVNRAVKPVTKTKVTTKAWPVRGANGQLMSFYGIVTKEGQS